MSTLYWLVFLVANVTIGLVIAVVPVFLKSVVGFLWALVFFSVISDFFFDIPIVAITDSTALVTLLGPISGLEIGLVIFVVLVAIGGLFEG
jgi:hypothetical protein